MDTLEDWAEREWNKVAGFIDHRGARRMHTAARRRFPDATDDELRGAFESAIGGWAKTQGEGKPPEHAQTLYDAVAQDFFHSFGEE